MPLAVFIHDTGEQEERMVRDPAPLWYFLPPRPRMSLATRRIDRDDCRFDLDPLRRYVLDLSSAELIYRQTS